VCTLIKVDECSSCIYVISGVLLDGETFRFFFSHLLLLLYFFLLNASSLQKSFRAIIRIKTRFFFHANESKSVVNQYPSSSTYLRISTLCVEIHWMGIIIDTKSLYICVCVCVRPSVENYISKRINRLERYIILMVTYTRHIILLLWLLL